MGRRSKEDGCLRLARRTLGWPNPHPTISRLRCSFRSRLLCTQVPYESTLYSCWSSHNWKIPFIQTHIPCWWRTSRLCTVLEPPQLTRKSFRPNYSALTRPAIQGVPVGTLAGQRDCAWLQVPRTYAQKHSFDCNSTRGRPLTLLRSGR